MSAKGQKRTFNIKTWLAQSQCASTVDSANCRMACCRRGFARQPVEGGRCVAFQHIRAGSAEVGEVCPERSALVIIQPVGMAIEFSGPRRREREFPVEA